MKVLVDESLPIALVIASAALWVAGLRLFLRSGLTRRRKIIWSAVLVAIGVGVGLGLSLEAIFHRFVLLLLALPLLAAIDVLALRSKRTFSFWLRACGFEVCTVFASASAARYLFDLARVAPLVG